MVFEALALAIIVVVIAFIYSFLGKDVEVSPKPGFRPQARR